MFFLNWKNGWMISYDVKFFTLKMILKVFYRQDDSKEFKLIDAVTFFVTIQKSRSKWNRLPTVNCQLF